jgi:hypothetical protein
LKQANLRSKWSTTISKVANNHKFHEKSELLQSSEAYSITGSHRVRFRGSSDGAVRSSEYAYARICATGNPIMSSNTTRRTAQFGISKNEKI